MTAGVAYGGTQCAGRRSKMKILYIQPGTTAFAGIELVVDTICTELAEKYSNQYEVDVLYISDHKGYPTEPRQYHAIRRFAKGRISLLLTFRDVVRRGRYDVIVVPQIEPTVLVWMACLGLRPKIVMHLHGNPRLERSHLKAKIMFFVMKHLVIRRLCYVFGTSPRQLDSFKAMFGGATPCIWVPNPVREFSKANNEPTISPPLVTFVNVGRFAYQKGQDILIDAFARLHKMRPTARLKLVGHGNDEAALRTQIDRLGLSTVVAIEHHPFNPQDALLSSDVFVATSRWEGWSLAICEALRFGLPVVAIDCEFGPSDILTDPLLGTLVPAKDADALVKAMMHYCDNIADERKYAAFRKTTIDAYSVGQVVHVHANALRLAAQA
jgi:glycosyltransferase involved in cell wall biosynthesis